MKTHATALLLALAISPAIALEQSAAGTYAIVHSDGHITDRLFRVTSLSGRWKLEDKKADGTWSDVTCQRDCELQASAAEHIQRIFTPAELAKITPDCVHNMAFAFCAYTVKTNPGAVGYVLMALVRDKPTPIRLARVKGG